MSIDATDEDVISIEYIDLSKSPHRTDNISNTLYSGKNNKKAGSNDLFYKWVKSLSPNRDTMKEEISCDKSIENVDPPSKRRIVY